MKKGKKSRSRSSRFEDSKSSDSINQSHIEEISLEKSKVLFREPFVVLLRKFCDSYEEYSERLKSGWKHTAFIHPSVLEGCIPYTPYIIIRGQTNEALCEPVSMQCIKKKSEIFFPKCDMGFKHEESVTLHPYYKKIKHADNIDVSLEPLNLPVNEELANHILRILSNRFIHCGMMRPFVLFDATYRCTILNISSSSLEKHSETEKSYNQCDLKNESSTSDLSLNETNCRNTSLVAHLEREQSDLNLSFTTQMSSLSIKDDSGNRIKQSASQDFYKVTYKTKLNIVQSSNSSESKSGPFFSDVAGLNQQLHSIKEFCLRFFSKENYSKMWGALICVGPHGTGKTLVAEAICNEFNVHVEKIEWHAIYSRDNITDAKREIRTIFQNATARTPSIILMDGFNYLCPNGERTDFHSQVSSIISDLVEGQNKGKVLIIACANADYEENVLKSLYEMMKVVKFPIPKIKERAEIFLLLLKKKKHSMSSQEIEQCIESSHGFTGKDLVDSLVNAHIFACARVGEISKVENVEIIFQDVKEAFMQRKRNIVASSDMTVKKVCWNDIGGMHDVKEKLKYIVEMPLKYPESYKRVDVAPPRGVLLYGPPGCSKTMIVCWNDIGGMHDVKEKLKYIVEMPLKYPESYKRVDVAPPRGVLLYGPPGCSKTMIAKALATESNLNFISKNTSDLFNKYVGESERAVRDLFAAAKARSPCIIFLDEIDALVSERGSGSGVGDRIVTTLLTEIDGTEELRDVIVIAATNRPDMLDDALVRSGRISDFIYVPLPDQEAREEILRIQMRNRVIHDLDFKYLSLKMEGYTGAEIVNLCNEAVFQLLAEDPDAMSPVFKLRHFEKALQCIPPRTSKEMIAFYENFNSKHSSRYERK